MKYTPANPLRIPASVYAVLGPYEKGTANSMIKHHEAVIVPDSKEISKNKTRAEVSPGMPTNRTICLPNRNDFEPKHHSPPPASETGGDN